MVITGEHHEPSAGDVLVRSFFAAANNLCGAYGQAVSDLDNTHWSSRIDAANQAGTALNGAENVVGRDLDSISAASG
jgi:hypothetical protein